MSRPRLIGLGLALATLLAYLPVLRNGFVNFDDKDYVTENSMVTQGFTWQGVKWAFLTRHASNWHPVTWLSHMADCELFRLNPAGHHLINLLLHVANACLLFILLRWITREMWPSAMVAALFALHPIHVESVAWVAERKDVLSTFFALLTLLSYVRCVHTFTVSPSSIRLIYRSPYYWLAVLAFALGLMSKPMLVTLPLVMVLIDFWPLQRQRSLLFLIIEKWPFMLLSVASCAVTVIAQRTEAIAPLAKYSLSLRLENVVTAYLGYLTNTFWPLHLAVFYPLVQPLWITVVLAIVILAGISGLACWRVKAQPYLLVGWLWYLGTLVPVIGLVQVGDQALADRYTYFPLIGIFLALVWAAKDVAAQFKLPSICLPVAGAAVLAACLFITEQQLSYWHDSVTLFRRDLAVAVDNSTARLNLGEAFQEQNQFPEALAQYREALRLDAHCHEAYNNIGRILNDQGKPAEALEYCRQAVVLEPRSSQSHNGLGVVLAELGRYDEATQEFSTAATLNPQAAAPHFQMGRVLLQQGQDAEAITEFNQAIQKEPDNLGMIIYVARVMATDQNPAARNGTAAMALAQTAAQLGGLQQPVVLDTLAMANAEAEHFEAAIQLAKQAVAAAEASGSREDATNMQARLQLYEKHESVRISYRTP